VTGAWTLENGRLLSDGGPATILELPFLLPEEYSFTIEFVRLGGAEAVILILSRGGKPFACRLGTPEHPLENGRVNLATVEVRKDRTTVWFNNAKLAEAGGDAPSWRRRHDSTPGLVTQGAPTEFRKIRLFELSGRGRPLRPK
jgi:hypothetical protein